MTKNNKDQKTTAPKAEGKKPEAASILKKNIKDLSLEDYEQLEKRIGTSTRPFPMWGPQRVEENGRSSIQTVLSFIADDSQPLKIYSERPYEEVVALAYCDMPVPSMLPIFKDGIERRGDPLQRQKDILEGKQPQNENFNRTQMMIGDPGHGKSFLGALQGRLRAKGSVEIFDCGGKNMNDLLFEMVLDFGAADALPKAIDKRLKAGSLEDMSLGLVAQLNNLEAMPESVKGEKAVAEWKEQTRIVTYGDDGKASIDWAKLREGSEEKITRAFDILTKISKIEGLDNAGGNALGMNSQFGALIRAFIDNREIVLDEYNKSREGSDNALQTVIQFLIGELRECTVDNPLKNKDNTSGPSSFTFKRDDMGAGFFVTFTGNKTEDGSTTRSLNKSVYDRLKPDTLPDPDVIDWQHRICQMMVGMPVSTIYNAFQEQADADPAAFGEWLMWMRETKAKVEGTPIPELQQTLLANWQDVVSSSEKLALFYDRWATLSDAEKITTSAPDLIEEVDEEYTKKEGMSFRRIKQHLEEAQPIRAKMQPVDSPVKVEFGAWNKAPKQSETVEENPSLNYGTRLVEYIERMVFEKSGSVGKNKLYSKLNKAMEEFGLRDISLKEGARSRQKSVEESLNISAFADKDLNRQAQIARKVFCNFVRQMDPSIEADDDSIITPKKFLDALKHVQEKETAATNELFVANRDPEQLYAGQPLAAAIIKDAALYAREKKRLDFDLDDLVHHDDFIASLALPTVGEKNLSSVWEQNIRPMMRDSAPAQAEADANAANQNNPRRNDGLSMAEGTSEHGIATTSLQVLYADEDGERAVTLHIVRNEQRGKTLVVGEKAPSKLLAAFREAGVTHVDRNDPSAQTKVEAAIGDLTRGMPEVVKKHLTDAFKYRNNVDPDYLREQAGKPFADADSEKAYLAEARKEYLEGKQLAELMVAPEVTMNLPKFVLKNTGPR
ncbi:MAG: hypothetical protein H3C49_09765 [Alphaproteobacteria bacterium]|nr:hypothetical protein [Alphaproteobacteria bacterium]HRI77289.1 hypothetical protein [Alphaproteobacteria bacterium]